MELNQKNKENIFLCQWNNLNIFVTIEGIKTYHLLKSRKKRSQKKHVSRQGPRWNFETTSGGDYHYVRFSRFYWHFLILVPKVAYDHSELKIRPWDHSTPSLNIDLDFLNEQRKQTIKSINMTFQQLFLIEI